MADENFSHTAQIMKAALPYVDVRTKTTMEFMYKLLDLMDSLNNYKKPINLAACDYQDSKPNIEGLLNGIRPFLSDKEKTSIDRILNIFNMKRMFETYSNYMSVMKTMPGAEGFGFGSTETGASTDGNPFNFSGLDFSSMMSNFSNFSNFTNLNNELNKSATATEDSSKTSPVTENTSTDMDHSFDKSKPETGDTNFKASTEQAANSNTNSGNSYNDIISMLESMLPPDQKDTYENISMLFNDKSYDDNNKTAE